MPTLPAPPESALVIVGQHTEPEEWLPLERKDNTQSLCEGSCVSFHARGSNGHMSRQTCLDCGQVYVRPVCRMQLCEPERCNHERFDRLQSTTGLVRINCHVCGYTIEMAREEFERRNVVAKAATTLPVDVHDALKSVVDSYQNNDTAMSSDHVSQAVSRFHAKEFELV